MTALVIEDPPQADHPRASSDECGATTSFAGLVVAWELQLLHGGRHQAGARTWGGE